MRVGAVLLVVFAPLACFTVACNDDDACIPTNTCVPYSPVPDADSDAARLDVVSVDAPPIDASSPGADR